MPIGTLRVKMIAEAFDFKLGNLIGMQYNQEGQRIYDYKMLDSIQPMLSVIAVHPSEIIFLPGSDSRFKVKDGEPVRTASTTSKPGDPIYFNLDVVNQPGRELSWSEIFRTLIHEYSHKTPEISKETVESVGSHVAYRIQQMTGQKTTRLKSGKVIKLEWLTLPKVYEFHSHMDRYEVLNLVTLAVDGNGQDITAFLREKTKTYGAYQPITHEMIQDLNFNERSEEITRRVYGQNSKDYGSFHYRHINILGAEVTEQDLDFVRLRIQMSNELNINSPMPSPDGKLVIVISPYIPKVITPMQIDLELQTESKSLELIKNWRVKNNDRPINSVIDIEIKSLQQTDLGFSLNGTLKELPKEGITGSVIKLNVRIDGQKLILPAQIISSTHGETQFSAILKTHQLDFHEIIIESIETLPNQFNRIFKYAPKTIIPFQNTSKSIENSVIKIQKFEITEAPTIDAIESENSIYPKWKMKAKLFVRSNHPLKSIRIDWQALNIIEGQPGNPYRDKNGYFLDVMGYQSTSSREESQLIDISRLPQIRRGDMLEIEIPFKLFSRRFKSRESTVWPFPKGHPMYAEKRDYGLDSRIYHIDRVQVVNQTYQVANIVPKLKVTLRPRPRCENLFN